MLIDGEEVHFDAGVTMGAEFLPFKPRYEFDGFTLRLATETDGPKALRWARTDPDHAWEAAQPGYWTEQKPRLESWVLEDAIGAVFFLRLLTMIGLGDQILCTSLRRFEVVVEVSIQFEPGTIGSRRTVRGLDRGMVWLEKQLRGVGIEAVYFNTKNLRLIRFALTRLGFAEVTNDYEPSRRLGFRRFRKALTSERTDSGAGTA